MNNLIGITGGIGSGKSTLCNLIIKDNPNIIYIDVDKFRRDLFNNSNYISELKDNILELNNYKVIDSIILNKYIYSNSNYMNIYKSIMYKYLFNYINSYNNKTIIVEWALILNDKIDSFFNKIIYVDCSVNTRIKRLSNSNLSKSEILERIKLQEIDISKYKNNNLIIINNSEVINMEKVNNFINGMECKFTLPDNQGKAIWEITHQCNYGCSYCMFSCNSFKNYNELTTEECLHVIDELVLHDFKHLKVTGGEPFLRKDIFKILEYASDKLITDISTNASLITKDKVEQLNELKLKMIHVSLDGNRHEHESVRGNNTYDRTIRGLDALKSSQNRIRIGSVIHYNNQNNLENLVIDACRLNASEIIFSIMEPVEGQDKSLIKTISNNELINKIEELKVKYRDYITINYNFGKQPNYVCKCPGGDKFIYINNLGLVSPCTWVHENDKSCISSKSLRDNSLDEVLKDKALVKFMNNKCNGVCYGKI